MKKILIILAVVAAFTIFFIISESKTNEQEQITGDAFDSLCFYQEDTLENGLQDRVWLRVENTTNQTGTLSVSGEYVYLPAEKDSKRGKFIGSVFLDSENPTYLKTNTLMTATAEGMTTAEEFYFEFNPIEARIAFGEMKDRGDGVYVYADVQNIQYSQIIPSIPCDELAEKNSVEQYVRENISTISLEEAVLGGSWYVTNLVINSQENSGIVTYEDGHIQKNMNFTYQYSDQGVIVLPSEDVDLETKKDIQE